MRGTRLQDGRLPLPKSVSIARNGRFVPLTPPSRWERHRSTGREAHVCRTTGTSLQDGRHTFTGWTLPVWPLRTDSRPPALRHDRRPIATLAPHRYSPRPYAFPVRSLDTSLELKKHVGAIHVKGTLSLLQRKAVNALLLNAYHELPDEDVKEHAIRLADLADALGYNSNDHELLKDTIETLVETKVRWNVLDADGQEGWGVSGLLASAVTKPRSGTCHYAYSVHLRRLLYNPAVYARINLAVQARFTSQYALALYENCLRFVRTGSTGWLPVADWRGLLGVGEGQYPTYKAFRQHVLAKAVKQVNRVGHIQVEMETDRRGGRSISHLRFLVRRGVPLLPSTDDADVVETSDGEEHAPGMPLVARLAEFGLTERQVEETAALPPDRVERNLRYVRGQIARGTKVGRLGAYTYRALTEDWAGAEQVAQQTQASLFDADAPAESSPPPPSPAALDEKARRAKEAEADALLRRLDEQVAALDADALRALDADALRALRDQPYPGWREVQEATEAGTADSLGPAASGALRNARRDVMAAWLRHGDASPQSA